MIGRGFEPDRVFGPDLARGIALLGMFAAHVVVDRAENIYDGRSSILFASVAGVSLGLLTGGADPPRDRRGMHRASIAVRGATLIVDRRAADRSACSRPLAVIWSTTVSPSSCWFPCSLPRDGYSPRPPRSWSCRPSGGGVAAEPTRTPRPCRSSGTPRGVAGLRHLPGPIWLAFPLVGLVCARSDLPGAAPSSR